MEAKIILSDTILSSIINAVAVLLVGIINLLFLYFKDKSEYETQAMILWKELGGASNPKGIVQMIEEVDSFRCDTGEYEGTVDQLYLLLNTHKRVRDILKKWATKSLKGKLDFK